jgi:hypothetical protein
MRTKVIALAVSAALAAVPLDAGAESRCDVRLFVFSRNSLSVGSADYNAYGCRAVLPDGTHIVADGPYDLRLINPSSDIISVRYANDDVPRRPESIRARLNGLGMRNRTIYLTRQDISLAQDGSSHAYDSGDISIDPNQQGCLDVDAWYSVTTKIKRRGKTIKKTVTLFSASTTYHTVDTVSC